MADNTPNASHVMEIYCLACEMLVCSESWEGEARILGNVRASDVSRVLNELMRRIEEEEPLAPIYASQFRFWVCPNGCRGEVEWNKSGFAKCKICGQESTKVVSNV